MVNGEWRMVNGEWRMVNGEWRMVVGGWWLVVGGGGGDVVGSLARGVCRICFVVSGSVRLPHEVVDFVI